MKLALLIVEFILSIIIIISILLQSAKGEGLAGIGGQARIFNSKSGAEAGLTKFTAICCTIFIAIALILSTL